MIGHMDTTGILQGIRVVCNVYEQTAAVFDFQRT
jgi:hypothetical protein